MAIIMKYFTMTFCNIYIGIGMLIQIKRNPIGQNHIYDSPVVLVRIIFKISLVVSLAS